MVELRKTYHRDVIIEQQAKLLKLRRRLKKTKAYLSTLEIPYVDQYAFTHSDEHFGEYESYCRERDHYEDTETKLSIQTNERIDAEKRLKYMIHRHKEVYSEDEHEKLLTDLRSHKEKHYQSIHLKNHNDSQRAKCLGNIALILMSFLDTHRGFAKYYLNSEEQRLLQEIRYGVTSSYDNSFCRFKASKTYARRKLLNYESTMLIMNIVSNIVFNKFRAYSYSEGDEKQIKKYNDIVEQIENMIALHDQYMDYKV